MKWTGLVAVICAGMASGVWADVSGVRIEGAWARSTGGQLRPSAAYLTIHNDGDTPLELTGVTSDIAAMAELHDSRTDDNGVSTMTPVDTLDLPPGASVDFAPRGRHIMLMGLSAPLDEGDQIGLTLEFGAEGRVDVKLPVGAATAIRPPG